MIDEIEKMGTESDRKRQGDSKAHYNYTARRQYVDRR